MSDDAGATASAPTPPSSGSVCWMDFALGGEPLPDRVYFELFDSDAPKTCANFRALCDGHRAAVPKTVDGTDTPLAFKGSAFHRVIHGFMIQGGDFTNGDGTGGYSIYGGKFDDEAFVRPCDRAGLLAMANAGPNTNGSQFFITCNPAKHLTGKHVVFGRVVRGMDAVRAVEDTKTGASDRPVKAVVISDCGSLADGAALPPLAAPADGDALPNFPQDCDPPLSDAEKAAAAEAAKARGNALFASGAFLPAVAKYAKALRYATAVAAATSALKPALDATRLACHNNAAQCLLKLGRWADARASASAALGIDAANAKALFRRAVALLELGDVGAAVEDLTKAAQADPGNADVQRLLADANQREAARKAKLAAGYKKMFSS